MHISCSGNDFNRNRCFVNLARFCYCLSFLTLWEARCFCFVTWLVPSSLDVRAVQSQYLLQRTVLATIATESRASRAALPCLFIGVIPIHGLPSCSVAFVCTLAYWGAWRLCFCIWLFASFKILHMLVMLAMRLNHPEGSQMLVTIPPEPRLWC